ncbi:MAG: hypothetical protein JWM68_3198 [Verrucomicrobiales bacterium]|nr:hypothetical protein [Verrucomicrobiales bacterium]
MEQPAFSHLRKHIQVEEVHSTEHQEDKADFRADAFQRFLGILRSRPVFQRQRYVTDVDEIESNDQQMIHGVGQRLIAQKVIDQKYPAAFVQRPRDPNREADADDEVGDVGDNEPIHMVPFLCSVVSVLTEIE